MILLGCFGCSRQEPQTEYQAFRGVVRALDVETGEVFVRADRPLEGWRPGRDISCVVTKDSETYINDRFSEVREIQVGDEVDVLGYHDRGHFAVTLLSVTRPELPAPVPAFVAPATQPAARPKE